MDSLIEPLANRCRYREIVWPILRNVATFFDAAAQHSNEARPFSVPLPVSEHGLTALPKTQAGNGTGCTFRHRLSERALSSEREELEGGKHTGKTGVRPELFGRPDHDPAAGHTMIWPA